MKTAIAFQGLHAGVSGVILEEHPGICIYIRDYNSDQKGHDYCIGWYDWREA